MKKIGMLTIGQTPRADLLPEVIKILGDGFEVVEAGALDGMTLDEVRGIEVLPDDYILVSRMRDGTEVKITKRFVVPLVQEKIREIEGKGIRLSVIMCTGEFPTFESEGLVVTPKEILKGVLDGALKKGRLGVVYPTEEQMPSSQENFGSDEVEVYADVISPYEGQEELQGLVERLSGQGLDLVFLNCFGFSSEVKEYISVKTGKPVIQSSAVVARVLKELAS